MGFTRLRATLVCFLALTATPVFAQTDFFTDDFDRPDGPLDGWTIAAGSATLEGGAMRTVSTTAEHWIWAGSPAVSVPATAENVTFEAELEFLAPGSNAAVGRHGGIVFCGTEPTNRYAGTFSGYFVDWIDRSANPDDRGVRFTKVNNGILQEIGPGQGSAAAPLDPPLVWRVETDDTNIRVYGDDVLYWDIADSAYRGGYFGIWTWAGDQDLLVDNFAVTAEIGAVAACFDFMPSAPLAGTDIFFDAGCSIAAGNIVSYDWNMGDGTVLSGETVEHTYAFGDTYTVTLTVEDDSGETDEATQVVAVAESLVPFADDFERADGPVDGWTVHAGTWNIEDGRLVAGPALGGGAAGEQQAFAGVPPGRLPESYTISFDWEFLAPADSQPVGRHASCYFEFNQPGIRWDAATTGYQLHWIDRTGDRGLNLLRWDGAGFALLNPPGGTFDLFPAPPTNIRIVVDGPRIQVFGDGILAIDVEDSTYRGGIFGLWTWDGAGNHVAFDNVVVDSEVEIELTACFPAPSAVAFAGGDAVSFDGSCSQASEGVAIESYAWDFGDGESDTGAMVSHAYDAPGSYTVSLTVSAGGESDTLEREVRVHGRVTSFADDFSSSDISTWQIGSGDTWDMSGGLLTAGPTAATEHFIWAGNPAVATGGEAVFEFDYTFLALGDNVDIGRHGGFQFHCSRPTTRAGGSPFRGYFVDWIDRVTDFGLRLTRSDAGVFTVLGFSSTPIGGGDPITEPPLDWRVETEGATIRVYGDGELFIEAVDDTYRGGFFGFWTWTSGQLIEIDAINVTSEAITPCFEVAEGFPLAGSPVSFDASCSQTIGNVTITGYAWDFGDGGSGNGAAVAHTYDFADSYTVTLTVSGSDGSSVTTEKVVSVAEPLIPFAECFDGPVGPPEGWTIFQGDWNVNASGELEVITAGAEGWIWAGDPPDVLSGNAVLEYDVDYLSSTPVETDGVGRHGGLMFFATDPTIRWQTSGYYVDWIDRETDFGVRFTRVDNGMLDEIVTGAANSPAEPPSTWRIEIDGPTIRVLGDGVEYVSLEDDTYREGYVGFWAYLNNQDTVFDNLRVGSLGSPLPECGEPPTDVFRRGDADGVGVINLTDGVYLLNYLFLGGNPPPCLDAADVNDDGRLDITTAVYLFNWLFLGGPIPPAPGSATCGSDPTQDALGCAAYDNC